MDILFLRDEQGRPFTGVGGGTYGKSFKGRWVLDSKAMLKQALRIRTTGYLTCQQDQAYVLLEENDILCVANGQLPVLGSNPKAHFRTYRIHLFKGHAELYEIAFLYKYIPKQVIRGMERYHNRKGEYFVLS